MKKSLVRVASFGLYFVIFTAGMDRGSFVTIILSALVCSYMVEPFIMEQINDK